MEKVALRYSDVKKRPLVLILNNVHLFKNDDDGKQILLQFQQRAEAWAASGKLMHAIYSLHANHHLCAAGIVTIVFSSCVLRVFHSFRCLTFHPHAVMISGPSYSCVSL